MLSLSINLTQEANKKKRKKMGIDCTIRSWLLDEVVPAAKLSKLPTKKSTNSKGIVDWDDALCRLHNAYGPRINGKFTGRDVAMLLFEPAFKSIFNGSADNKIFIIVLDDDECTPKEKKAEQKKRSENKQMYPLNAQFCDEGIKLTHNNLEQTELIDLERVLNTRQLRTKLWSYCLSYLSTQIIPARATIIFSFKRSGPYVMCNGKKPELKTEWAHGLGETDTSITFWMWLFHEYDFIIHTIDTDIIPIMFSFIAASPSTHKPPAVVWQYIQKRGGGKVNPTITRTTMIIDMYVLYRETLEKTQLNAQQFILACILSKTDFYEKGLITYRVATSHIFQAIMQSKQFIMDRLTQENKEEENKIDNNGFLTAPELGLDLIIRIIHMLKLQSTAGAYNNSKINVRKLDNHAESYEHINNKKNKLNNKTAMMNTSGRVETFASAATATAFKIVTTTIEEEKIWNKDKIINEYKLRENKQEYPTIENIKTAHKQLTFNLNYWLKSWQTFSICRRNPEQCNISFVNHTSSTSTTTTTSNTHITNTPSNNINFSSFLNSF
jgi:hypothetical protein